MPSKIALITGITGQDGSYLAEWLIEQGYEVHGTVRRCSTSPLERIQHLRHKLTLHPADLLDQSSLLAIIKNFQPQEIYNLAAQSFVGQSWQKPLFTSDVTALGVLRVLEAIRLINPDIKFYQASSSEMFGKVHETPQRETTVFHPRSPYGVAKVFGHHISVNYRESYQMFACSGILFNHESPRRGIEFVTRKITDGVAQIKLGHAHELRLGNLDAKRDWGFAGDYVRAMWLMLQQDKPRDYVVGTGKSHSVRDFVRLAFDCVGLNWKNHVVIDPEFYRPAEVDLLEADSGRARRELGWQPKVSFEGLVEQMVHADLERWRAAAPPILRLRYA